VPSRDGVERALVEALRDRLWMMFSVGFAKSYCSTWSAFLGVTLLLSGGVVEAAPPGSALPVSGIKTVVAVPHQGNTQRGGVESIAIALVCDMPGAYHGNCILARLAHGPGSAGNDVVFLQVHHPPSVRRGFLHRACYRYLHSNRLYFLSGQA
jgi:hypothetical protein